ALSGQLSESPWQLRRPDAKPLDWRAQAGQLLLRPARQDQPDWLAARELSLALQLAGDGRLLGASAAPGRLEIAGAALRWQQLQWQAARQLGEPPQASVDLEMEPLKVAPLLARWQPDFGWGGDLTMGGRLRLRSTPQVEIEAELGRASGDLSVTEGGSTQTLGLSELRLALQAKDGTWHLAQGVAGSNLGVFGGAISTRTSPRALWPGATAPLEGGLLMDVANLGTWGAWVPAGWRLGGTFHANVQLAGQLGAPEIRGRASGSALQLRNPLLGVDLREGELALSLDGPTATLERLQARGGDGRLSAQGRASFGAQPQAELALTAERFTFLGRVDRRVVASGQANLKLAERSLKLDGRVAVDEGLFDFSRGDAPTLDSDVQVLRAVDPQAPAGAPLARPKGPEPKVDVQVAIDLGRQLRVRGRGVDTRLRGELRLIHQGAGPLLNGTVSTHGGTYDAYGQKLEIEKGEITFAGVLDNPRLDVLAVRPNTDVRVGVTVTGTALNPRIKLYSEPDMADTDKLSWLLMGRGPDGLGRADTALLQRAALALLSGEGESPSGKLIKNLGLDELSVSQDDSDARGTVVRLGKQLSRRWYVGYERTLGATTGSWQLIYRIVQRFTLRAQAGEENAVDLIWQWKWN
ncbi:MAG TPA: translocation/assembly module TamB domain-containing protein, partial [Roseateles sp.]|nr:translocation/assembly module TamB domain-containing protein [Roseateles sp.]